MSETDTDRDDLIEKHQASYAFGYCWTLHEGAEPPEWYVEQRGAGTVVDEAPQRCEDAHAPPVPEDVEWSAYTWYSCSGCGWPCINREDSAPAEEGVCWNCLTSSRTLPDGREIVKDLE